MSSCSTHRAHVVSLVRAPLLAAVLLLTPSCGSSAGPRAWTVASPDGTLELRVTLDAEAASEERGAGHRIPSANDVP
ncbi:MAG: hypothetical protein H6726_19180 [Sandaracinaceae bacterium]|nr:hypothetical protein [Sandaracinaceae bacterium]